MAGLQVSAGFSPERWRLRALVGGLLLVLLQSPLHAAIWGYIDDKGVAHFAAEQVDERYELFSREKEGVDVAGRVAARPVSVPTLPPKLIAFFEVSPSFKQVKHLLREASSDYRIDFELLQAVIATESGFDAAAVSPKGAVGLMQIMPATAQRYGVKSDRKTPVEKKLTDPRTNIRVGSRYLRDLMGMFPGQPELALAAYNAGEGAVLRAGSQVPRYRETQSYVRTVMQLYAVLKPPAQLTDQRQGALRGGATGRGNMLASLQSTAASNTFKIETD
jgi:soluble lytic murein transglycosylase-like protein